MRRVYLLLLLLTVVVMLAGWYRQRIGSLATQRETTRLMVMREGKVQTDNPWTTRGTVEDRQRVYGPGARVRMAPYFTRAGVAYPPARLVLVGIKQDDVLQVYAAEKDGPLRFVMVYPILAASGHLGPKLREGDHQVPEGLYRIEALNPNSSYHLSLRVSYPNAFDRRMARVDGRTELGGDIMIHGSTGSVGCLAMGDEAAEDLFILAADTGIRHIDVILTPVDFRREQANPRHPEMPSWVDRLYARIKAEMRKIPLPTR